MRAPHQFCYKKVGQISLLSPFGTFHFLFRSVITEHYCTVAALVIADSSKFTLQEMAFFKNVLQDCCLAQSTDYDSSAFSKFGKSMKNYARGCSS